MMTPKAFGVGASWNCRPMQRRSKRPQVSIAKLHERITMLPCEASISIEQRVGSDELGLREA